MLVGAYPFEDPADPRNFRKTIQVGPAPRPAQLDGGSVGRSSPVPAVIASEAGLRKEAHTA